MSRPRSRSPHYRRFPWEEPDFDPRKVIEELDGNPRNRSHRFREGPEELGDSFREEMYPESQRRSPFPDDPQFGRHRHPGQEFHHRSLSPRYDEMRYDNRRFLPPGDGGFDNNRHREGFTPRESGRSRGRERGRGQGRGRFRYFNPGMASGDQRVGGMERERRNSQGSFRDRPGENPHHDRVPPFKEPRREMDDISCFGYGDEEDFGGWGNSADRPRGGYGGRARGNHHHRHTGPSGSLVIEYDHSIAGGRSGPRVDQFVDRGFNEPDFDRQRSPRSVGPPQKRFRTSGGRLDDRKDTKDHPFQNDLRNPSDHETRSPNTVRFGQRDGPMNNRGGWRHNHGQGGRMEPPRSQPRHQDRDEQRASHQPFRGNFEDPDETDPNWAEEIRPQRWKDDRPRSLERQRTRSDSDPKMPPQRELGWSNQKSKNMTVTTEETLTIKVDMSRPVNQKSPLCYSSDRQLSFDLVNVGRQRLDFLPMLEHSGTYRETATHTGTFAQEIITLVHLVKEQYFRGEGLTLNQRFSAPQEGRFSEGEGDGMTLDQRFSSNRGFSLNTDSLLDEDDDDDDDDDGDDPLFSRLGSIQTKQPLRGPGDLRHDLERRRQEKLEAVKVTIPGSGTSQRSHGTVGEADSMPPMDHDRFSNWPEEQNRSRERNTGPRRGAPNRPNMGPQRWNHRSGAQRQNMHNSPAGPNW